MHLRINKRHPATGQSERIRLIAASLFTATPVAITPFTVIFFAIALFTITLLCASNCFSATPFQASQQLLEAGQVTEARRALQSELRMRPNNLEARYNLAILLGDIGQHQQAQALYKKNLELAWHLPSFINLASALNRQGKTTEARKWLEKASKKIKHEATAWYLLAAMSEQSGHTSMAIKEYRQALKVDPLNGFGYLRYAEFQARHQLNDNGLKHAAKATRLLPGCAPCWRIYGNILQQKNHKEQALIAYQHSLSIEPDSATRQQLIRALHSLGQIERARRMQQGLDAWRKHHPD